MLIKTWTFQGVPVADAEHRVGTVNIEGSNMTFRVTIHAPGQEAHFEAVYHGGAYDPDGGDVTLQAEAILLAHPSYDGASAV